MENLLNS